MGQKIWSGLSDIVRGRRQPAPPCVRSEAIDILSDCFFAATVILYTFVHRGKGWQHVSRTSRARSNTRHASLVNLRDRTNYNVYPSDFTAVDHPLVSGPHSNDMAPASWHVPAERQRLRKHVKRRSKLLAIFSASRRRPFRIHRRQRCPQTT
jgi:hypothetical protein